ncbi:sodium:proton antiporter [Campylobacter sp. MIT 12-8780]|uniref:Mrp/NBP35 family ATP-binding protein n=1 Tax=unclassified Campylobacter TaxID=2593542 RepID=UPI00115E71AA|nr:MULTISPECIES: Mrp/NBP35 family ATP-binding protein [unclassified Campylobacter]NDJ27394.1 Mrp/NBP35 family ATP-binding protein [Campylobacter sp. MIT 19-121]TQR40215.1 sodium:proton antiporter [Campylobacter sp. MIT 12-8780]
MVEKIKEKLKSVKYPGFSKDILAFNCVKKIDYEDGILNLVVEIFSANEDFVKELDTNIKAALKDLNLKELKLEIKHPAPPKEKSNTQSGKNIAPQIQNFVMISSGKGGVGKSTTTLNLAINLAKMGKKVGLLDLDIYGPNIPRMMGQDDAKVELVGNKIKPILAYGVEMMSMGVLVAKEQGLIWRGAMIMKAVEQLLTDVLWGELDVLLFDMPPGTGDAQISLAQSVPVSAGICVSTPQLVSIDDSKRTLDMFEKLHIPIAGIIENMSGFLCPDNGKIYEIFGKGGTQALAKEHNCEVLAQIPLEMSVREGGDSGKPVSFYQSDSLSAKRYDEAAHKLWDFLEKVQKEGLADNTAVQPVPNAAPACSQ